jgi:hypothetical protein
VGRAPNRTDKPVIDGVVLALVASVFTASASVSQRFAAAPETGELSLSLNLIRALIRKPIWFAGILCMILGFGFQLAALRVSSLSLVQPVIAVELLLVFGFLALRSPRRVQKRDWLAAIAMAVGLAVFLGIAHPQGGTHNASVAVWLVAAACTVAAAAVFWTLAQIPLSSRTPSPARQAALLATAAGVAWGFVAAVIKELSSHLAGGPYAVFTNWSPYVLLIAGAGAFFLLSNAFQAGPLAASQPSLTIVDPLVASMLGVFLFRDRIRHDPIQIVGESVALLVLVGGVILLSRSDLVQGSSAERAEPVLQVADAQQLVAKEQPGAAKAGDAATGAAEAGAAATATATAAAFYGDGGGKLPASATYGPRAPHPMRTASAGRNHRQGSSSCQGL